MSDRLAELRRQRSLVIEQLTWLDREIQRETGPTEPPAAPPSPDHGLSQTAPAAGTSGTPITTNSAVPAAPAPGPAGTGVSAAVVAETFADLEVNTASVRQDVKKGCLIYLAAAFGLIGVLLVLAYFTLGKR